MTVDLKIYILAENGQIFVTFVPSLMIGSHVSYLDNDNHIRQNLNVNMQEKLESKQQYFFLNISSDNSLTNCISNRYLQVDFGTVEKFLLSNFLWSITPLFESTFYNAYKVKCAEKAE